MRKQFRDLPRKHYQRLFAPLTLGEQQLLLYGLHVLGEQNRVDLALLPAWRVLTGQLKYAMVKAATPEVTS